MTEEADRVVLDVLPVRGDVKSVVSAEVLEADCECEALDVAEFAGTTESFSEVLVIPHFVLLF